MEKLPSTANGKRTCAMVECNFVDSRRNEAEVEHAAELMGSPSIKEKV